MTETVDQRVVALPGVTIERPGQPQADVVEVLERLLAAAKAGELKAIAFATVDDDLASGTGWKGGRCAGELAAAIYWLSFRYGVAYSDLLNRDPLLKGPS